MKGEKQNKRKREEVSDSEAAAQAEESVVVEDVEKKHKKKKSKKDIEVESTVEVVEAAPATVSDGEGEKKKEKKKKSKKKKDRVDDTETAESSPQDSTAMETKEVEDKEEKKEDEEPKKKQQQPKQDAPVYLSKWDKPLKPPQKKKQPKLKKDQEGTVRKQSEFNNAPTEFLRSLSIYKIPQNMKQSLIAKDIRRAMGKENIKFFNQLISDFGNKKQLTYSLICYSALCRVGLTPTVYTFANLINACVRCGELDKVKGALEDMKFFRVWHNEVTYTAAIKGWCQDGKMDEAMGMLQEMREARIPPNLRTFNTILRGCLRWGRPDLSVQILDIMREPSTRCLPDVTAFEYSIKALAQVGRLEEAWDLVEEMRKRRLPQHAPIFSALATSSALWCQHGKAQEAIDSALSCNASSVSVYEQQHEQYGNDFKSGSVPLFLKLRRQEVQRECDRVRAFMSKIKVASDDENFYFLSNFTIAHKFGFFPDSSRVKFLPRADGKEKRLRFSSKKLFGNKKPVKMEVCSGHGEWLVDRAALDKDSNWIGLEIRYERVYQIWSKMVFKGLDNLLVLGGEANAIFSTSLKDNSLDEVYVNYPDPPIWEHSKFCLLSEPFFREVHRCLKPGCSLVIVTDDQPYSQSTVKALQKLSNLFESEHAAGFSTDLPEDYGTSYFDRFWVNGGRTTRYYMNYKKKEVMHIEEVSEEAEAEEKEKKDEEEQ